MEKRKILLLYCAEAATVAQKIALQCDLIRLHSIRWRSFEAGFPDLFSNDAKEIRGHHVAFLASFSSPEIMFEQIPIIYAIPRLLVASFTLILPFFPTGMEENMRRNLSNISASPIRLVTPDICKERFFGDYVQPFSVIPLLKKRLKQFSEKIVIVFPDNGAWERFHNQLDEFPMVICDKVRKNDKSMISIKEGNPEGCHAVIVDDLVQLGETLITCQKVLALHGATKVSAYVTHGLFSKLSYERFMHKNDDGKAFAHFWITDSCPASAEAVANQDPFEVISLDGSIADALIYREKYIG